jgi:hypothetical protein
MARPSILTDDFIAGFCSKLRVCGSIETAIKASGCGRESYYGWARKVRDGEGSEAEKKFIAAVEKAESEVKMFRESKLNKHFDKNWQAIAWWLERKYSHEYGQRRPLPLPDPDAVAAEQGQVDRISWELPPSQKKAAVPEPSPEVKPEDEKDGLENLDAEPEP